LAGRAPDRSSRDAGPTQIGPVLDRCVTAMSPRAAERGVRLEGRIACDLPDVLASPANVERVIMNLLSNPLSSTPAHGWVAVTAGRADSVVRVCVEDSGRGIAPSDADRIFDRFWRGDPLGAGGDA